MKNIIHGIGPITEHDIYLFKEGRHFKLREKLGAHPMTIDGVAGVHFAVWAPNAEYVSLIGNFNNWDKGSHPLKVRWDGSGIWEGFAPGIKKGTQYKYHVRSKYMDYSADKGDPFALLWQTPPDTASVVWELDYTWNDREWMEKRKAHNSLNSPFTIYEVHLGSWKRKDNRHPGYRELAHELCAYVKDMGFTHVELLPVMEHPFYGSWGYQTVGYFAPTSRYGSPEDFMYFIDHLHQNDIGVILDWVPSHFPADEHGLAYFDGTHLFEHADMRKGFHPEWNSYIFNYGRYEVMAFLISSALFWLEKYHVDAIRVDAVASILYLDYSRKEGEWIPNKYDGRENLEAIEFLKRLNTAVYKEFPDVQTIAEESTSWPMVSRPIYLGGLGFGMKWNMGWMHDILDYLSRDPVYRKHYHNDLTFSIWYAFSENFLLPLSHDEVVHGKGSLTGKMPGDEWQRAANLKTLFGYMYTHPGKKLLFMGNEFGQVKEWSHEEGLEWHVLAYPLHYGIQRWVRDLNHLYKEEPCLHESDFHHEGFEWVDFHDWEESVVSFIRKGSSEDEPVLVVLNFTPIVRHDYIVGVPKHGFWEELLNSDSLFYNGSGVGNMGGVWTNDTPSHGKPFSLKLTLPPLSTLILKRKKG
ncbi:MAG: 1,4-alpha-glucan branching protein GlgB [Deltaproteobacteria bacterium]|nr:1,4-alpha-glucan branching protein GlgB [Deltaproteobacteria bacterium]